ncbi:protein shisa-6 isoform X1 [Brienomyrus brachyistius]|uniref:protein shisa-6 isoform X1 n=1 Tax=Brienomyrus brachyistius TaxID=42636 RepID=UPI0020B2F4DD|nr:protein shisa-6 isoform X1 [Brienomyrus brachyistius]
MGIQHLVLLLIYLDPLNVLCAAMNKKNKGPPKRTQKVKEVNSTAVPTMGSRRVTQVQPPATGGHDTCQGYYDVSGQYDKEFECNNTDHRYCCGSCFLRFCCQFKGKRLDQKSCTNYNTPDWIKTQPPSPVPTGETYDPNLDRTNTTVYITCGVIAFIIILGVSAKVAYDKATKPPQEMNVHRALADILRQQGPVPISQYDHENIATMNGSPKENTPVRTSKNHYTPVHAVKSNHGYFPLLSQGHYGKENFRSGGQDLHNFISSGFVTLARPPLKAQLSVDGIGQLGWPGDLDIPLAYSNQQHNYSHLDLTALTPKIEKPRLNRILTSQTEPYDLSFSRSFQNLAHSPPSYEIPIKSDLSDKDLDDYYPRKHHLPELPPRAMLPLHMDQQVPPPRQRPRRVQRAMSQDHVLSPERAPPRDYGLPTFTLSPYHGRILSEEQLLSAERLQSQDPLLSPEKMLTLRRHGHRDKVMSRAMSHADMLMPTTPVMDRHVKKIHLEPSPSVDAYNTLTVNQCTSKRQAFASRRTHTVDHLQYIPGHHHHYQRTASKTEVTV